MTKLRFLLLALFSCLPTCANADGANSRCLTFPSETRLRQINCHVENDILAAEYQAEPPASPYVTGFDERMVAIATSENPSKLNVFVPRQEGVREVLIAPPEPVKSPREQRHNPFTVDGRFTGKPSNIKVPVDLQAMSSNAR